MFFGVSATLLAAVGIVGVTARGVAQRARELGIRIALGAQGRSLVRMVVRESLTTALAGTAIGLLAALWASRLLTSFLFGVEPLDPLTFTAVATLLGVVCLGAAYLSSRRIVYLDAMTVLKAE